MKNRSFFGIVLGTCVFLSLSCARTNEELSTRNLVTANEPATSRIIGDEAHQFLILGQQALQEGLENQSFQHPRSSGGLSFLNDLAKKIGMLSSSLNENRVTDPEARNSLVLGFPKDLLGKGHLFGGVVTEVSDKESQLLGRLKLADIPPLHVTPEVTKNGTQFVFVLMGCPTNCTESSQSVPLVSIPIVAIDDARKLVMVDLAAVGKSLNLIKFLDPDGSFTKLVTKSSQTVSFDYSNSTLVFDIEVRMVPLRPSFLLPAEETVFKARWFLVLGSSTFHSDFESRKPTEGVGFFLTKRAAEPKIHRQDLSKPAKYYIKFVPNEYKSAFVAAFNEWNSKLEPVVKQTFFEYEFIDAGDPRASLLVTGDPRYRIVEWDLINKAPYGGLGPSIANQMTGEILTANVFVQGPHIVSRYKKWFEASNRANALRAEGKFAEADELLRMVLLEIKREDNALKAVRFELTLGNLAFRIPAQGPELEDPIGAREDFDEVPSGYTYETYMSGYFRELLAHELGHNLGLRHNFRGNLKSGSELGEVSSSIMEYLSRLFRHRNRVSGYDMMAMKYGYAGILPEHTDLYCTDEDVADAANPSNSAECSRDDATKDPFSYFTSRLERAVNLLIARNEATAPTWTVDEMADELGTALKGISLYALSAGATGAKWTNFFGAPDRPSSPQKVRDYVAEQIHSRLCDSSFAKTLAAKESEEARQKTEQNIHSFQGKVASLLKPLGVFSAPELSCNE